MKKHEINLGTFTPKGHAAAEHRDGILFVNVNRSIPESISKPHLRVNSYVSPPGKFRLPMRIDIEAKIDAPGLHLFLGNGHISFGTEWQDNRRLDDIAEPSFKPKFFHNHIPMNEYAQITVIYDLNEMQILVNGEERYYSKKEKYMKSALFAEMNMEGFTLKITCSKHTNLTIKSVCVAEFEKCTGITASGKELPAPVSYNKAVAEGEKPTFETCISLLPVETQSEIIKTDEFLRSLKPLNFKRTIDKYGGKITYVASEHGFSYAFFLSNDVMHHALQWYIVTNGKVETWRRKADMMDETLERLAETSPELAEKLFSNLKDCVGCYTNCLAKTKYKFGGKQGFFCHGSMAFTMRKEDFDDARAFIAAFGGLVKEGG